MRPIGGFFELELPQALRSYHPSATPLNSGRACVGWLLDQLKPRCGFVPFYSCDSLAQPFLERGIPIKYLHVDESLHLIFPEEFTAGDVLVCINHFGLKGDATRRGFERFLDRLIIDNTQAFFEPAPEGAHVFNSARKFFGVPDGAYLSTPLPPPAGLPENDRPECAHLIQRYSGRQREAYESYRRVEAAMDTEIRAMSQVTRALLSLVDYELAKQARLENFSRYHKVFDSINELRLDGGMGTPFCYPLLPSRPRSVLRRTLAEQGIFLATYWPEVIDRPATGYEWEKRLAAEVLPLPVDHRYKAEDIDRVISSVLDVLERR